jgi:hypothetical protein
MGKINKQKIALAEWQKTKDEVQQDIAQKILPLQQQMAMENLRLALLLDDCILRYNLTKNQKRKIKEVITDLCAELAHQSAPIDDPAFDALCKRYYDKEAILAEQAAMEATMRATFEQTFGVKLEESDDIHDVDFLTQKLFEKLQADHLAEYPDDEDFTPPPKTHKTSKQRAQAEKAESDETLAQQSIQGIYRQLVQTLHPDRETDPSERERKTLVMQKVTVAYEEKNLVELLSLQQQEMKKTRQVRIEIKQINIKNNTINMIKL